MATCIGILLAGLGISMLLFRDFMWEMTQLSNEFKGVISERTDMWELGNTIGGVLLIGLGAFVICAGISADDEDSLDTLDRYWTSAAEDRATIDVQSTLETHTPVPPSLTPAPDEIGRVTRIIDGDTIEVSIDDRLHLVRYLGINAPDRDTECGEEAIAANADLVEGKTVSLYRDVSDQDLDERLLRYVYVGETFINAELVRLGFANVVNVPPDDQYSDEFTALSRDARRDQRGCIHDF